MIIKNILFDFDGVILDSMPIRHKGFELLFANHPFEKVNILLKYHEENGGLSRYHKIRYFYENILDLSISEEEVIEHASRFSEIMRRELINPSLLISDAVEFIKANHKRFPMHIVSGSDGNELRFLCKKLGLDPFFISIDGSPTPKITLVNDLLQKYGYPPSETVLVGDSINDYEAAEQNNIRFLGYRFFTSQKTEGINQLEEMSQLLKYC